MSGRRWVTAGWMLVVFGPLTGFLIRVIWHPGWWGDLSGTDAMACCLVGLGLWRRSTCGPRPRAHRPRHSKPGQDLAVITTFVSHVVALRLAPVRLEMARLKATQRCMLRFMNEISAEAGYPAPDLDPTGPQPALRLVPPMEKHHEVSL